MNLEILLLALLKNGELVDAPDFRDGLGSVYSGGVNSGAKKFNFQIKAVDDSADWWFDVDVTVCAEYVHDSSGDLDDVVLSDIYVKNLFFYHPDGRYNLTGNKAFCEFIQELIDKLWI